MWFSVLIGMLVSYFLGNLNGAVCMSALMHDDVRNHGSGNAGLTNFIREYGAASSLLVILIDAGKAVLSCFVMKLLLTPYGYGLEGAALGGLAVMLGHTCPALLGFRGGKGILSGLFIALCVDWRIAMLILAVFALVYLTTRYVSLGSVLAAVAYGVGFALWHHDRLAVMLPGIAMAVLAVIMHRGNIQRLIAGQERRTNLFGKGKKS